MKLAVYTVSLPEYDLAESVAVLKEMGYEGVEWRVDKTEGECPRGIRANSAASFTRCASPPERVVAGCPRVMYPSPTSCKVLNLRANPVMCEKSSTA